MKFKTPLTILTLTFCMTSIGQAQENSKTVPISRYSVIEIGASEGQLSLLQNIVDIDIPLSITTVGDGIHFILAPYGYGISTNEFVPTKQAILLTRLLPDPHRHLVEMTVIDALRVLGGESFKLNINPVSRTVKFELKESYQHYVTSLDIEQANLEWRLQHSQRDPLEPVSVSSNQALQSETYGPILSGETLGSITETIGLNGLSLAQRMIQIFQHNPHTFSGNNMNALLVGAELEIPFQTTASMTQNEAAEFVRVQYSQWLEGRVGQ
ncbi:MAG: hypothetical protein COA78_24325 [Blastopirellula sp.]|nr:MAG: hypothetical protein COA78_24325 [Blastopirellula sp.]